VIKTVPLDIPVNFLIGSLIALAASRGLRAGDNILGRQFKLAVGYSLWFGLTVTYFYFAYPDWMYGYALPVRWPLLLIGFPLFIAALAVAGGLGALATSVWIARGVRRPWIPAVYGLLNWAAVMAFMWNQYMSIGTFQEYQLGTAIPLNQHAAIRSAMNIAGPAEIIPAAAIILYLWFSNRKRTARPAVEPASVSPGSEGASL